MPIHLCLAFRQLENIDHHLQAIQSWKHPWKKKFGIGFNIPFNTFQVISGQCLLITECMTTTLKYCLNEISHSMNSRMISRLVTLYRQWVNQFLRWITLYMSSKRQGCFNYYFKIFSLTAGDQTRHWAHALPLGYQCWLLNINHSYIIILLSDSEFKTLRKAQFWNSGKFYPTKNKLKHFKV